MALNNVMQIGKVTKYPCLSEVWLVVYPRIDTLSPKTKPKNNK